MASTIDVTKPTSGTPTTASVRANFQASKDEIEALQANTVTAGSGLTGGGAIADNVTFAVGSGTGITVNANDVALDAASDLNVDHSTISVTAGDGLTGGGTIDATITFNVVGGDGITANADNIEFDTTWGDARYALDSHTHTADDVTGLLEADVAETITANWSFTGETLVESISNKSNNIAGTEIDCSTGNMFWKILGASTTFTFTNAPAAGQVYEMKLIVTQGASLWSITWPAGVKWDNGTAPGVIATGDVAIITFITIDGGTTWYGISHGDDFR